MRGDNNNNLSPLGRIVVGFLCYNFIHRSPFHRPIQRLNNNNNNIWYIHSPCNNERYRKKTFDVMPLPPLRQVRAKMTHPCHHLVHYYADVNRVYAYPNWWLLPQRVVVIIIHLFQITQHSCNHHYYNNKSNTNTNNEVVSSFHHHRHNKQRHVPLLVLRSSIVWTMMDPVGVTLRGLLLLRIPILPSWTKALTQTRYIEIVLIMRNVTKRLMTITAWYMVHHLYPLFEQIVVLAKTRSTNIIHTFTSQMKWLRMTNTVFQ